MTRASIGRAGTRGGAVRREAKKCGKELKLRQEFRRRLAKLHLWWRNAGERKKFPKKLREKLKLEMGIVEGSE